MSAVNPEFAIIHLLVFDHPDGKVINSFGAWNYRKLRDRARKVFSKDQSIFTVDKVERMAKRLQKRGLIDTEFVPMTKRLLFYSYDREADNLMKEVFVHCRKLHPDINLDFSRDRLSYDLEDHNVG